MTHEPLMDSMKARSGYWYLASPYSSPEPSTIQQRVDALKPALKYLFDCQLAVYSPILHWHPIVSRYDMRGTAEELKAQNLALQQAACGLLVLALDGWRESIGVRMEIAWAIGWHQPISVMEPAATLSGYALRAFDKKEF